MANSTRKRIIDNLVTTLAAITTGGGYNLSVGEAKRGWKHFNNVSEDLLTSGKFCIYAAGADEKRRNHSQREFRSDLLISVVIYVMTANSTDTEGLEQILDNAIEDATKAIMVDVTRGGYSVTTEIGDVDTDKGAFTPYASAEMIVRCEYRASVSAP